MNQSIRSIIREEVEKVIRGNEFTDDKLNFNQLIVYPNAEFNNYEGFTNDYDTRVSDARIVVNWGISFRLNEYGIEKFQIDIKGVKGQYRIQFLDKQTDEVVQEADKNIEDIDWKFTVVDNVALVTQGTLYVRRLSFDFKDNTCFVEFYKSKNIK